MRHPFSRPRRLRIENLEGTNHLRVPVAQEGEVDLVPVRKFLKDCPAIVTNGRQLDPLLLESLLRVLQLDQLRFAERSPIGGTEEKQNGPVGRF
jgi:hypothetical protein